jgi:ribosome-associated protein
LTTKKKDGEGAATKTAAAKAAAKKPVAKKPAAKRAHTTASERPRIRASHSEGARKSESGGGASGAKKPAARTGLKPGPRTASGPASSRKTPLSPPKRPGQRRSVPPPAVTPEAKQASRDLALAISAEGMEKKALGIEILDVSGRVDYADFLVVMTGRSDRHVHAIATGLEEAMRKKKMAPLSVEGLQAATWVLLDFGDVVVHVFQEDSRLLYDIEGLWIDVGRIPLPAETP